MRHSTIALQGFGLQAKCLDQPWGPKTILTIAFERLPHKFLYGSIVVSRNHAESRATPCCFIHQHVSKGSGGPRFSPSVTACIFLHSNMLRDLIFTVSHTSTVGRGKRTGKGPDRFGDLQGLYRFHHSALFHTSSTGAADMAVHNVATYLLPEELAPCTPTA